MIEIGSETISILEKVYVVANTPSYVYRHFRAEEGVQTLGKIYDSRRLVEHIVEIERKEERTLGDIISAYAATVALTFKNIGEVKEVMRDLRIERVEWAVKILSLWIATCVPTDTRDLDYDYRPIIDHGTVSERDSTAEEISSEYNYTPKILFRKPRESDYSTSTDEFNEDE
jgi:hypothetical protein